jgi:putative ABC transport system substrate-binding protein
MDRRRFLLTSLAGALAAPLAAEAQQAGKVYPIGVMFVGFVDPQAYLDAFRQGLRELGWMEGRNIELEVRAAEGKHERLHAIQIRAGHSPQDRQGARSHHPPIATRAGGSGD